MLVFFLLLISVRAEHFWTTAQITDFEMKESCLHTLTTCTHPRIQITAKMLSVNEAHESSWNLHEQIIGRFLASDWTFGYVDGVLVSTQILGIDSTYGIERVCDRTAVSRPFPATPVYVAESEEVDGTTEERSIDFEAKCFNVTLTVKQYTGKCPWCPEPEQLYKEKISQKSSISDFVLILVYILLMIIVVFSIGSVVLFSKIYSKPKNHNAFTSSTPSSPGTVRTVLISEISRSARTSTSSMPPSIPIPIPLTDHQLDKESSTVDNGEYEYISREYDIPHASKNYK